MNAEIALNALIAIYAVAIPWWLIGWAIYGGERGKQRRGGIFAALWQYVVTPYMIVSIASALFFGVGWLVLVR